MLAVRNLAIAFVRYAGIASRLRTICLRDVSLAIGRGELVAVIGESGAGKSLLAHAVLGILPANAECKGR